MQLGYHVIRGCLHQNYARIQNVRVAPRSLNFRNSYVKYDCLNSNKNKRPFVMYYKTKFLLYILKYFQL